MRTQLWVRSLFVGFFAVVLFHGISLVVTVNAMQTSGLPSKTVWDGAYTEAQATRGHDLYDKNCASCHGNDLNAAAIPALSGEVFLDRFREGSLDVLFGYIQAFMPRMRNLYVSDPVKLDIVAYLLQRNGFPSGANELTQDTLGNFQLVGKDGPKPLPNLSQVRVVGCLVQTDDEWFLNRAIAPIRARDTDLVTAEEIKAAEAMQLGAQTLRLTSIENVVPSVDPAPHKGHKMLVKGILSRRSNEERVNVMSIQMISGTCGQ